MKTFHTSRISRRQFLISGSKTLAGLTLAFSHTPGTVQAAGAEENWRCPDCRQADHPHNPSASG